MTNQYNRRRFLRTASGAAAGLVILRDSRSAWGYHANDKLNVAVIGAGGMGAWNLTHIAGENVEFLSGMRVKPASHPEMVGRTSWLSATSTSESAAASAPGRRNPPGDALARYGQAKKVPRLPEDARRAGPPDRRRGGEHSRSQSRSGQCGGNAARQARLQRRSREPIRSSRPACWPRWRPSSRWPRNWVPRCTPSDNFRRIVELIRAGAIGDGRRSAISGSVRRRRHERPPDARRHRSPKGCDWDLFLGPAP